MYNEDFEELQESLTGVLRGYAELCDLNRERFEEKVAVVIIADGFDQLSEEFIKTVGGAMRDQAGGDVRAD